MKHVVLVSELEQRLGHLDRVLVVRYHLMHDCVADREHTRQLCGGWLGMGAGIEGVSYGGWERAHRFAPGWPTLSPAGVETRAREPRAAPQPGRERY